MIELLVSNADILNQNQFLADEVRYNLIHRICESEESTCLKTSDKNMIFAQSPDIRLGYGSHNKSQIIIN